MAEAPYPWPPVPLVPERAAYEVRAVASIAAGRADALLREAEPHGCCEGCGRAQAVVAHSMQEMSAALFRLAAALDPEYEDKRLMEAGEDGRPQET